MDLQNFEDLISLFLSPLLFQDDVRQATHPNQLTLSLILKEISLVLLLYSNTECFTALFTVMLKQTLLTQISLFYTEA
jgi:hypothetical protein